MDGLHEMTAAESVWNIGGKEYRLAPLRLRDYGEMEQRILAGRPDPLAVVRPRLEGLPEPLQRHLLSAAYDDARRGGRVTVGELDEWMDTVEGRVYQFWLAIRRNHPEVTLEEADALLCQAGAEHEGIQRQLQESRGLPAGN
jgi:hypothetical protein